MRKVFTPAHESEASQNTFSSHLKGKAIKLNENKLIASGDKGYRTVLGTQGVAEGTFYYELTILNPSSEELEIPENSIPPSAPILEPLLTTANTLCLQTHNTSSINMDKGASRVGFATNQAELEMCVGADKYGFGFRSIDGCVFHEGFRKEFSSGYEIGSIISCLIHLPPQRPRIKGVTDSGLVVSEGSEIHFFKNGRHLGCAFKDFYEGCYFPAVALYEYSRAEINLSPEVRYPEILETYNAKPFFCH